MDGEYEGGNLADGARKVFDLTWRSKNALLTEKYGIWLVKHDVSLALKVGSEAILRHRRKLTTLSWTALSFSRTRNKRCLSTRATCSTSSAGSTRTLPIGFSRARSSRSAMRCVPARSEVPLPTTDNELASAGLESAR